MAEPGAPARENVFTRRIGPLPMWAWVAIISVPLLGYGLYKSKKGGASTSGMGTASTTSASDVPQYVGQTYVSFTPPAAPTNATPPGQGGGLPGPPGAHPRVATVTAVAGGGPQSGPVWMFSSPGQVGGSYNSAPHTTGGPPIGAQVFITGPAVQGAPQGQPKSPSTTYFPFSYKGQTGFLSSANLAGTQ